MPRQTDTLFTGRGTSLTSLAHQLRGQFPKPMPETSGEGAGIFVTHFRSHLHDGVLRAAFQQAAGFFEPDFLHILNQ